MYESFYGFKEKPFSLTPDPSFLYLSKTHELALTMLEYGVENRSAFTLISGEIGAGKTTLVRKLLDDLDEEVTVGLISNTHKAFGELLQWILLAYGLSYKNKSKVECYQTFVDFLIEEYAAGRRTVLILDEAQNLGANTMEELRVLSNVNADKDQVLQLILVGQPEIRKTIRLPELEQFAQRIAVDYHLRALTKDELYQYVKHRLKVAGGDPELFDNSALRLLYTLSKGVPRIVNSLCDTALVYSFADQSPKVTWRSLMSVVKDKKHRGAIGFA